MTSGLGLESVGIALDTEGRIPVNERFATVVDAVWPWTDAPFTSDAEGSLQTAHVLA
jgi:pyruvate/2-oxoglutarate dehydrogenase complex dihydrolipoamide dehydrogenase (E3) component